MKKENCKCQKPKKDGIYKLREKLVIEQVRKDLIAETDNLIKEKKVGWFVDTVNKIKWVDVEDLKQELNK